jgi:hypothetical protein
VQRAPQHLGRAPVVAEDGGNRVEGGVQLGLGVVMSLAWLVPINNRSKTWTADNHPADWREQQQRWDRLHYARVAVIVAAFVLTLVSAVTG